MIDPKKLRTLLRSLSNLRRDIEDALDEYEAAADTFRSTVDGSARQIAAQAQLERKDAAVRRRSESFSNKAAELGDFLPEEGTGLGSLFSEVSDGLVTAQRELDRQTEEYLKTNPVLPSTFRIPKVTTEFRFALESTSTRKVNLVLFGTEDSDRERQQHRVSFDIVAAPLPAEMIERIGGLPLQGALVTNLEVRRKIRRALWRAVNRAPAGRSRSRAIAVSETFLADLSSVLAMQGKRSWVLLRPVGRDSAGPDRLELLYLDRASLVPRVDAAATAHPWIDLSKNVSRTLREVLGELVAAQKEYLAGRPADE